MLTIFNNSERPIQLWCVNEAGDLIDFSVGSWTFVVKFGVPGNSAVLTKSSGITGVAGSGVEPSGTANITITPTADEFAALAGLYTFQLRATASSADMFFQIPCQVLAVIT